MRMAMVEVIGNLIRELSTSTDLQAGDAPTSTSTAPTSNTTSTSTKKQLQAFHTLLLSRTLDLSSYVRTRTLATLTKLLDLPTKFPSHRLAITRAAVEMLSDKASGVRRGAVGLLGRLVVTHPWGLMHGGLLGLGEWEERYRKVKEELEAVEGVVGGAGLEGEEEWVFLLLFCVGVCGCLCFFFHNRNGRVSGEDEMDVDEDEEGDGGGG